MGQSNGKGASAITPRTGSHGVSSQERAVHHDAEIAAPYRAPWFARRAWGTLLCTVYPLLVLTPLLLISIAAPSIDELPIVSLAFTCAIIGFPIICMQFVLTARFRWIEAPFGLDVILRFHKGMALIAVCLLCAHPLLLAWAQGWWLLTRWNARLPIWAGRIALLLLVAHGLVAIGRRARQLRYETWLLIHNGVAFILLGLALVHSLALGGDFAHRSARSIWVALPLLAWSTWFYRRVVRPHLLERRPYTVAATKREAPAVWTITLEPPPLGPLLSFAPGQFLFMRPLSGSVLAQEHPFSISSSPTAVGQIRLTIKECGDFTSTIRQLALGDRVALHGPFGRFSHMLHPHDDHLVFIAGGVGITPFISMLRHMRDRRDARRVTLIYANREPSVVLFEEELESISMSDAPRLNVIHIVSRASGGWEGLTGRLDAELIARICPDLLSKRFFICCPPPMTTALIRGLRRAGVRPGRIHAECFGL